MLNLKTIVLKSRWVTAFLLFCLIHPANAQISLAKHQIFNGFAGHAIVTRDAYHGPLTYEGFAAGLSMGYTLNTSNFINRWNFDASYGLLYPAIPTSELQFFGGGVDYSFLIGVFNNQKNFRIFTGFNSNTIWNNRLHNQYTNNTLVRGVKRKV